MSRSDPLVGGPSSYVGILPVLFLEYLALSLTRAILPSLLTHHFRSSIYLLFGVAECVKGCLAFFGGQFLGRFSDAFGRRLGLLITVSGTTLPLLVLSLISQLSPTSPAGPTSTRFALQLFVLLFSLSGFFAGTFTIVFAYISDTVEQSSRVSAFGLALATFGASFTIGPMLGGYLANPGEFTARYSGSAEEADDVVGAGAAGGGDDGGAGGNEAEEEGDHNFTDVADPGVRRVFTLSMVLVVLDLLYIYFLLPESLDLSNKPKSVIAWLKSPRPAAPLPPTSSEMQASSSSSDPPLPSIPPPTPPFKKSSLAAVISSLSPLSSDPFLSEIALITLLYYTGVWAVVSTLSLYCVLRFNFTPARLGELMSAFGLCTVFAEGVLVRVVVPVFGEVRSMRAGLLAFSLQCCLLAFAWRGWQVFLCLLFSTVANLVYPSVTSLVSSVVPREAAGETLGAINGVKAVTEGFGPLLFGILMSASEGTTHPGLPYLLAAAAAAAAYWRTHFLPDVTDELYVREKVEASRRKMERERRDDGTKSTGMFGLACRAVLGTKRAGGEKGGGVAMMEKGRTGNFEGAEEEEEEDDDESAGLLSQAKANDRS